MHFSVHCWKALGAFQARLLVFNCRLDLLLQCFMKTNKPDDDNDKNASHSLIYSIKFKN